MTVTRLHPILEITSEILGKWKKIVENLAEFAQVPVALLTHVEGTDIEVFATNKSSENPFRPGSRFKPSESALFCDEVIRSGDKLHVINALTDDRWCNNAELQYGLIAYLGYPIFLPNKQVYGTLALMDTKGSSFTLATETLLQQYKEMIETHLALLVKSRTLKAMRQKYSESLKKIQQLNKVLQLAAATDPLTKLMNRRTFNDILRHEKARQRRNGGEICLVMGEIDGHESLKGQLNHPAEEQILVHTAAILQNRCRAQDFIWRWAEKEFLLVLPETPLEGGVILAEKLCTALEAQPAIINHEKHPVSMSFGAIMMKKDEPVRDSLNRCKRCLYKAQNQGAGKIESGE
jgi:diguanylate cyclase (GGDEF)-like protein